MATTDRDRWDARYAEVRLDQIAVEPPAAFADIADQFPTEGRAIDIACGRGAHAVWLAQRGLRVEAFDVSPQAIAVATDLAASRGVADRCGFAVVDLDDGLPSGPAVDLVLCHMFRSPSLDLQIIDRLKSGGLLAVAALSEVGAQVGRFRVEQGELLRSFEQLDVLAHDERDGTARLLARKR